MIRLLSLCPALFFVVACDVSVPVVIEPTPRSTIAANIQEPEVFGPDTAATVLSTSPAYPCYTQAIHDAAQTAWDDAHIRDAFQDLDNMAANMDVAVTVCRTIETFGSLLKKDFMNLLNPDLRSQVHEEARKHNIDDATLFAAIFFIKIAETNDFTPLKQL